MGTSVNQRSPDTTAWQGVQMAYEDPSVPVERVLREVWRSAAHDIGDNLTVLLAQPIIGSVALLAVREDSAPAAVRAVTHLAVETKAASLAADIATRAVIQTAGKPKAESAFLERLFVEATNYLVSRDLPGHVGRGSRLATVSDAMAFKQEILSRAAEVVSRVPPPVSYEPAVWADYTHAVISTIQQRRRR